MEHTLGNVLKQHEEYALSKEGAKDKMCLAGLRRGLQGNLDIYTSEDTTPAKYPQGCRVPGVSLYWIINNLFHL